MALVSASISLSILNDGLPGATGPQGPKGDTGATGATGLGCKYFGERSWDQSSVNTYTQIGYSSTWTQTVAVATITGDTIYLNVNNTTTGKKGVLYLLVTSGASASVNPSAKVVSYIKDGDTGATGSQGPKGDTGNTGPSGATSTPYYQYALKKTGVTPSSSDFQNTIPTPWYYGQVYWLRVRYVWSDGRTDTYSDPWLDDNTNNALILSCKFEISADATNYVIDRRSGDSQNITFTAQQSGYNLVSFSWVVTDDSDVKTGSQISVPIAKSTAPSSFTATCTLTYLFGETQRTLVRTITISSVDVTEYNHCFGIVTQEPATALEGDCYVIEDDGDYIPYVYESGDWVEITDFAGFSVQASQIRDVVLSNGINVPRTSAALYAYFMNLSAQNANLDFVSTSDITLKTSGRIHSDGYTQGTVKKLIDGELDPSTTKKGFYQDYDGNAEFFKTDIFQANINEGVLNNVTVNGKLNSATLVTQLEDEIGNSYRNKDITTGKIFWCESDIVSLIAAAVPHNSVVSCVGYFADTSFVNAIYVDDNTSSISLGKQTAWMAPVDARVTPSGGTNLYVNGTKTFPVAVQRGKGAFVLDYLGTGGPISGYSSGHQCITAYTGGKYYLIFPEYLDILSSTDGKNWTVVQADITEMKTSTTSNWEKKFIGGNNRLLYLSYSGELFVSTNGGTSWSKSSNFTSLVWGGSSATGKGCTLNFCNNKFYALVEGSSYAYESTDGLTWSQSFSSPYTSAYAMVYYNGKYTLFSFNKYTGYNAVLAISSTDLVNWTAVTTDADMLQLTDVCVTNDGTYVMVGYSNSSTAGIAFSKDLTHWSPIQNPAGTFYMPSLCTNGTDVVCSNSYNAAIVSAKYTFGGNLSYKLNYQLGLHFINQSGAVFASPVNAWRSEISYFTYNGTRLYYNSSSSVETDLKAYIYSGMQKLEGSSWINITSGDAFTFSSITFRYQLIGQSERTISSIQSITWTSDQLTVIGSSSVTLNSSSLLAGLTLTFVPVSRSSGNYTKSIFPMEDGYDIGASDNRYYRIYGETIYGDRVYGAYWNDIADAIEVDDKVPLIPGRCYVKTEKGHALSSSYCQKGIVGIHSDTYGFLIGQKGRKEMYVAVGGFVLACTDKVYKTGTALTSGEGGKLTKMKLFSRILHPERIVGTFYREEKDSVWNGINVSGRHWIKVR